MQEDDEIIREFLIESNENLNRLDSEIVDLEKIPTPERVASIFRTIHTIKGTCGFLGFSILERITHHSENILSQIRAGQREVTGNLVSVILESVDAVRQILSSIEATGQEGDDSFPELIARLEKVAAESSGAEKAIESVSDNDDAAGIKSSAERVQSTSNIKVQSGTLQTLLSGSSSDNARPVDGSERFESEPTSALPGATSMVAQVQVEATSSRSVRNTTKASGLESERLGSVADSSIRVDVSLLDKLMNLVGELVLARNQILQFTNERDDNGLNATSQRLSVITSELQEGVMKTRMQPIGVIWNKLPRVVRDVANSLGKQIQLEMSGSETELDKTIIEAIKDPITHMVRNACDHGIEEPGLRTARGKQSKGKLSLKAYHEGGQVNIEISDDGGGIDVERVKRKAIEKGLLRAEQAAGMSERDAIGLLFQPGFSTAQTVTNVSGRGVGMDVVRANVERIGGTVDVTTRLHEGTAVKVKIPLTLAIIPGLLINTSGHRFVIPQISLVELIRLDATSQAKIEFVHQTPVFRRRGKLLPVTYLSDLLKLDKSETAEVRNMVVLEAEKKQFGLIVDGVNDTQEIVVKPLGKQLKSLSCYSGSTIMGDGSVALILDVIGLAQLSGIAHPSQAHPQQAAAKLTAERQTQPLLLFRSGSFSRLAVPLNLVARLEEIAPKSIEYASGRRVIQYRGRVLPLVPLASILEPHARRIESPAADYKEKDGEGDVVPLQVIVFGDEQSSIGLIVDQIIDIVEEAVTMKCPASPIPGILGSAVVGHRVADFLDLQGVVQATSEYFSEPPRQHTPTILVGDSSTFQRSLLRNQLEMTNYKVLEAANLAEALVWADQERIELMVLGSDLLYLDHAGVEKLRTKATSANIPMLAISNNISDATALRATGLSFDDHQLRSDRAAMMNSIASLARAVANAGNADVRQNLGHFSQVGEMLRG